MNKKITTKLYTWLGALFLVLFMSMGATAQETIHYWNFNTDVPASNVPWPLSSFPADIGNGQITHTFNPSSVVSFAGTTINAEPSVASGGSLSILGGTDLENNGKYLDIAVSTVGYENIELSYAARGTGSGFTTHNVTYSTDGGSSFNQFASNTGFNVLTFFLTTVDFSEIEELSDNANVVIRIQLDGATGSNGNNRIDNIKVEGTPKTAEGAVATPSITPGTSSIASGNVEVSISVSTEMASIYYTLDGSVPTTSSTLYSAPFEISQATSAEVVTVKAIATAAELTNSDVAEVVYTFPIFVANLGELRANSSGSTVYTITSEVVLTGQDGFRNTKFVQDATGAVQIDDPNPAKITTSYNVGDGITGLTGTLGVFEGQYQFTPVQDPGAATSANNTIAPVVRTLATLTADDQSKLVQINKVEFQSTGTFGGGGSQLDIVDPSLTTPVSGYRNIFGGSNVTGSMIPEVPVNIVGIVQMNNSGIRIGARSLDDITVSPTEFVTEWQRSTATDNLPSWFAANRDRGIAYVNEGENHYILVASSAASGATGNVYVLDALTGADVGELNLTSYTGTGTFVVSDVMTSEDGKIFVTNFGQNSFHNFRVNMFDSITDASPTEVLNDDAPTQANRDFARAVSLIGNYSEGTATIYAISTGGDNTLARFTQTGPGQPFGDAEFITLSTVGNTPQAAAVGTGASAFYQTGTGQPVRKYNDDGTLAGTISTDVLGSGTGKIAYLGSNEAGDEFIAVYDFPTNTARLVKVVGGDPTNALAIASTSTLGSVTNGNGTGDITAVIEEDGSVTVFVMGTNNGIGAFSFDESLVIPPATSPDYAYVQLIHNSADPALAMVDVYVNSTEVPIFTNVAYRSATVFLGFEAGISHSIILTPAGQSVASGIEFDNLVFMADENYYAVVGGVIDPSQFAVNPSGVSTALAIDLISGALLVNPEGTQEVAFVTYHGSTDAPGVDITIRDVAVITVNAMYTDVVDYVSAPADAYIIDIAPTGGDVLFSYSADFSTFGGQTAMVIASGFLTPSANKDGEEFALIAVLVDGTVVNLPLTSTDIESGIGLPDDFRLSQNYPNPFNPTTRIEFDMPVSGDVTLAVYDLLGRQVALLANENYAAGTHNIAFDASQLASGVYVYRLNVAGQTFTRKMTLVK